MIKKKKTTTAKSASVAFTGTKGFDSKPIPTGGGGGGDFLLFRLPQGAEDVPVVMLEDEPTWVVYHETKNKGEEYWSRSKFILSPRDPEKPHLPSFIEKKLEAKPALGEMISKVKTAALITVWVPSGVPGTGGKTYQENGIKLLLIPPKSIQHFKKCYAMAREKGRTLMGAKFSVSRSQEKTSAAIGTTWMPTGYVKLDAIEKRIKLSPKKWAIDWKKLFLEIDQAGFKKLLVQLKSSQAVSTNDDSDDDGDDIPF